MSGGCGSGRRRPLRGGSDAADSPMMPRPGQLVPDQLPRWRGGQRSAPRLRGRSRACRDFSQAIEHGGRRHGSPAALTQGARSTKFPRLPLRLRCRRPLEHAKARGGCFRRSRSLGLHSRRLGKAPRCGVHSALPQFDFCRHPSVRVAGFFWDRRAVGTFGQGSSDRRPGENSGHGLLASSCM